MGGRKESEKRASWRSRAGCRRASRKASASETPGVDAPHRTAVDDDRDEDQRLILRRILEPALRRPAPGRQRAHEQRVGGRGAPRVHPQAAGHEALVDPAADRQRVVEDRGILVLAAPRHRAVDVGARQRLAPRQAAERQPGERRRRRPGVGDGELDQPADERVDDDRVDAREVQRRRPRAVQRDDGGPQVARRGGELVRGRRAGDRGPQVKRRPRLGGDQVGVLHDAEHPAGRREHGEVAHAAIEHVQPHLAAQPVGRDRVGRRRHRLRDRRIEGQPAGHHACAQVAIGEDPERPAEVDDGDVAPVSLIRCAASRMLVCGAQTNSALRMSAATGWCAGRGVAPARSSAPPREAPAVQERA